jgi:glycosyltransferase involved in cell wall biosynthesis
MNVEPSCRLFNYIVPIFNKEDVLPLTLDGINRCASKDAKIFAVLDGCTDGSERVVDEFVSETGRNVVKVHMPNVHMLRSVNAAWRQIDDGYTMIMQDDIVLGDPDTEAKLLDLYARMGERLGVVSLRAAANVRLTPMLRRIRRMGSAEPMIEEVDFIRGPDDAGAGLRASYSQFHPRIGAINGPNCVPPAVRKTVGLLDEALAPYGFDDPEYGLRAMKAGFINGLYALKYRSDIEWGGTRRSNVFRKQTRRIHLRNRTYIWRKHGTFIRSLWESGRLNRNGLAIDGLLEEPAPAPLLS